MSKAKPIRLTRTQRDELDRRVLHHVTAAGVIGVRAIDLTWLLDPWMQEHLQAPRDRRRVRRRDHAGGDGGHFGWRCA